MLSGAIGGVLLTADYIRYVHRYVTLDNLRKEILYSLENMPPCDNLIAQTYTELLETIQR
jgi:hypothetical protein